MTALSAKLITMNRNTSATAVHARRGDRRDCMCHHSISRRLIASVPDSPCSAETAVSYIERFRLAPDAFTVATFVPAQADICRLLDEQTTFDVRNILIDMSRANDLRSSFAASRSFLQLVGTRRVAS